MFEFLDKLQQSWSRELGLQGSEGCTPRFAHSEFLRFSAQRGERAHVRMRFVTGIDLDDVSDLDGEDLNQRPWEAKVDIAREHRGHWTPSSVAGYIMLLKWPWAPPLK